MLAVMDPSSSGGIYVDIGYTEKAFDQYSGSPYVNETGCRAAASKVHSPAPQLDECGWDRWQGICGPLHHCVLQLFTLKMR